MDLWIRSQDKSRLVKCESLSHGVYGSSYEIRVFTNNYDFQIGVYESKERAIEILDEIQNFIENNYQTELPSHGNNIIANGHIVLAIRKNVYEMPKE